MPPLQGLPSDTQAALLTYGTHSPGGPPLQRSLVPPTWPSSRPTAARRRRKASRLEHLPAGSLSLSSPCGLRPCLATPQTQSMDASQARPFLRLLGGCKPVLLGAFRAYRCRPGRGIRVVFDGLAAEYTMVAKLLQVSLRGDLADLVDAVLVQRHLDSIHMITSLRTTQPTHPGGPCQPGAADGRPRTGATGCPTTGSGSEPRSEPERTADAKPNSMRTDATASEPTATTSSQATTTAWTTCNGFHRLAIKPRPQGKPQRAMHGIVNQGFIPSKKIRDRSNPGWGAPPRGPQDNRRIAPPIMRASSRSFFSRIPAFLSFLAFAFLWPVYVAGRGTWGKSPDLLSVTATMFLPLSRNKFKH